LVTPDTGEYVSAPLPVLSAYEEGVNTRLGDVPTVVVGDHETVCTGSEIVKIAWAEVDVEADAA